MNHLEIGNAAYKEILLNFFEDETLSYLKKKKFKKAYTEEESVRDYIRNLVLNTKEGKRRLKSIYDHVRLSTGIGYKGLWSVKVNKSIKDVKEKFDKFLKTSGNYGLIEPNTYEDVFASIFMIEINSTIAEEIAHAECDYWHEDDILSKIEKDDIFLDFVSMMPIEALKKK
jgi:hypothetical protein